MRTGPCTAPSIAWDEKPDPRFFHIALERSGADAATTMPVGDLSHVDVAGARAAGLTPALLDVGDLYPECDLPSRALAERLVDALDAPLISRSAVALPDRRRQA